jgi:hypothetical protein
MGEKVTGHMPVHGLHIWRHPLDLGVKFRYRRVEFGKCLSRGILCRFRQSIRVGPWRRVRLGLPRAPPR